MINETPPQRLHVDWLPAERLGQAKVDSSVRPWLIGKGLLTARLKEACSARFSLRVVEQRSGIIDAARAAVLQCADEAGLFRDVALCCGESVWVYARTVVPDSTLTAHPWLAELGEAALGETLDGLSGVARSPYEYAWLPSQEELAARALRGSDPNPGGLWARRSRFALHGAPLLVQELFLPNIGRMADIYADR